MKSVQSLWLKIILESDTTFGRGDGVVGLVDAEVQHDEYGLPFLSGRTLKGLLGAECAEVKYAINQCGADVGSWVDAFNFLFGAPGSRNEAGHLRVGDAQLPEDLRLSLKREHDDIQSMPDEGKRKAQLARWRRGNLESLTALRRQTAVDTETSAPLRNTLRTMRVIIRETVFVAQLDLLAEPKSLALPLLAAGVQAFHRAGTGRNRGRGRLHAELYTQALYSVGTTVEPQPITDNWFSQFIQEVRRASADVSHTTA